MAVLLCSRYSATVQKGRRFFTLAGKDMELPNGKRGKKKAASKRQQAASPAAPAPDGGSPVEGEMAGELLTIPGPSGMCAGSSGSVPPVPAEESAAAAGSAAVEPTAVELVVTESPPPVPAVEPEGVQPEVSAVEPVGVELSVPAAEAVAAAPAAEAATTVRLVSEARPVLANGPAAASKECWVLNPGVRHKVILRKHSVGPAAAAGIAAAEVKCAGEPVSGPELPPAARRAAAETESPPTVMASGPTLPKAAAAVAPVKRKAKTGVIEGSQKRKKSSPVKIKDL
jgi:hypothetical protein